MTEQVAGGFDVTAMDVSQVWMWGIVGAAIIIGLSQFLKSKIPHGFYVVLGVALVTGLALSPFTPSWATSLAVWVMLPLALAVIGKQDIIDSIREIIGAVRDKITGAVK